MGTFLEKGIKELYMYVMGAFVVGGCFGVVVMLITTAVPPTNHDIVVMALGTLLGMAITVVTYFFGSSKSSADKSEIMAGQSNPPMKIEPVEKTETK